MKMRTPNRSFARLALLMVLLCTTATLPVKAQTKQAKSDQFRPKTNITPGFKIINGDLQVPLKQAPGASFKINSWPNGVVYYEFDANVTDTNRAAARAAMEAWMPGTGLRFLEGRGRFARQNIYIHIQNSTGNNSALGVIPGGQIMNITSWGSRFIIAHEVGHALGLHHEHERPDRDLFVQINNVNIQSGFGNQFTKQPDGTPVYGPYDFDSLMHYDRCSFSTACPAGATCNCTQAQETIQVLGANNAVWQSKIGQRTHISYLDATVIASLYPRGNVRFVDVNYTGRQAGSFLQPYQSLATGINATPRNGAIWMQPGIYRDVSLMAKPMTLRAPLGGVTIRPVQGVGGASTLASISAASYNGELAADSIAAAFGVNLAASTAIASSQPLPTTLAGVTVKVKDAAGTERPAPLFFVSPNQINYQIPPDTSPGIADVAVYSGDTLVANGPAPINSLAPALFTANASGQGAPAAIIFRVRADGSQSQEPAAQYDAAQQRFVPIPVDLGPEGEQVFLILFGTGFRLPSEPEAVTAFIDSEIAEVLYAGAAPGFVGLDQANVRLPRSLAGKGEVGVLLMADGRSANAVTINIR